MDYAQAKKLLGPNLPILTLDPRLDQELYIWLAIIYRQFIAGWYNKIHADGPLARDFVLIFQQIINVISSKCEPHSLAAVIQDLVTIVDLHISDTQTAFDRNPDTPETIYLGLHPHDGLMGRRKIDEYFFSVGERLTSQWLINAPPLVISLLSTIVQQVLGSVLRSLSEPWMIHELLIKVLDPTNQLVVSRLPPAKSTLRRKKTRRNRFKKEDLDEHNEAPLSVPNAAPPTPATSFTKLASIYGTYLTPHPEATTNESIFLFIQNHFISRSLFGNFVLCLGWPFHPQIARYTNSVLLNATRQFSTVDRYLALSATLRNAVFPGGYLGPPRVPPPMAVQADLRQVAMQLMNRRVQWIDFCLFDSNVINQRFLLSVLDYVFKIIE